MAAPRPPFLIYSGRGPVVRCQERKTRFAIGRPPRRTGKDYLMLSTRKLDRRELLGLAAGWLGAGAHLVCRADSPPRDAAPWIDAHVHVWTADTGQYPLAAGYTPRDMMPRSFTPDELMAHARPVGVGRVVLIQMSYYGFDNQYMLDVIRAAPEVFRGVAVIDDTAPEVADTMRALAKRGVRGFRLYGRQTDCENWLDGAGMETMWKVGEIGRAHV